MVDKTNQNIEQLIDYINQFERELIKPNICHLTIDKNFIDLANKISEMIRYISEMYSIVLKMTEGKFSTEINNKNPFIGPIKEMQSILFHLNWQIKQVANGDYQQSVDYLGEISESFNDMINKLKNREQLLVENTRLKEEVSEQQTHFLEQELKNQVDKYKKFSDSIREVRVYHHDMKNHLFCLDSLLQENNVEDARKYINSLTDIFHTENAIDYGENHIFNALLNDNLSKAEQMGVFVTKKVEVHKKLNIDNKDWCILFANALDNALEALEKVSVSERFLSITVINVKNTLCVKIVNSMNNQLQKEGDEIQTTKEDKYLHGLGIKNIQRTVNKYDGEMKIETDGKKFALTFILFKV